jgi:MFS family permease
VATKLTSTVAAVPAEATTDSARGWVAVAGATLSLFTVFGVAYSFGAFFTAMSEEFDASKGSTAVLFGLANFVYFTGGVLTGRLADRIGPRPLALGAAALLAAGLLLTSVVDDLWLGYLTYGLGVGGAVACGYVPMVAMVGGWFTRSRTAALGIAVAGIGLGNLVATYVSAELIDANGWRSTYRAYAVLGAVLLVVAAVCSHRPPMAPGAAPVDLRAAIRRPAFRYLYGSMLVLSQALFVPFVFLPAYARDHGIDSGPAALLVGLIGGASIVGRLALGTLGGRMGVTRLYQTCFAAMSATLLLWLVAGSSYPVLVLFALSFGVSYGGFIALAPAVAAEYFGTQGLGAILGALYTAAGLGGIGLYLAGELIEATDTYTWAIVGAIALSVVSVALLLPLSRPGARGA